jgi:hypothetical protein
MPATAFRITLWRLSARRSRPLEALGFGLILASAPQEKPGLYKCEFD